MRRIARSNGEALPLAGEGFGDPPFEDLGACVIILSTKTLLARLASAASPARAAYRGY